MIKNKDTEINQHSSTKYITGPYNFTCLLQDGIEIKKQFAESLPRTL